MALAPSVLFGAALQKIRTAAADTVANPAVLKTTGTASTPSSSSRFRQGTPPKVMLACVLSSLRSRTSDVLSSPSQTLAHTSQRRLPVACALKWTLPGRPQDSSSPRAAFGYERATVTSRIPCIYPVDELMGGAATHRHRFLLLFSKRRFMVHMITRDIWELFLGGGSARIRTRMLRGYFKE